ncbi:alpha/beta hydrolase, partial [Yersinia pestis]
LLELDVEWAVCAATYPRDLALHLEDEAGEFQIECLIFEQDDTQLRALFKHGSFEVAERLLRFVQMQKMLSQT